MPSDAEEFELLELIWRLVPLLSAIVGAIVGGIVTFRIQSSVQRKTDAREQKSRTLDQLERAQLSSQRLSSKWRKKVLLFEQKARNSPFQYLTESQHPGDEKFELQFLIQAFFPEKFESEFRNINNCHQELKAHFEKTDKTIREKAVVMATKYKKEGKSVKGNVVIDEGILDIDDETATANKIIKKLDESISSFKESVFKEIEKV